MSNRTVVVDQYGIQTPTLFAILDSEESPGDQVLEPGFLTIQRTSQPRLRRNILVSTTDIVATSLDGQTSSEAYSGNSTLPANPLGFLEMFVATLGQSVRFPFYSTVEPGKIIYGPNSPPSDQIFIVPDGVTSIHIKLWGAGGGGAGPSEFDTGGWGGYTEGDLAVTSGLALILTVGEGGKRSFNSVDPPPSTYGGGAMGGSTEGNGSSGSGGGRTAIGRILPQTGYLEYCCAGGGGGGAYSHTGSRVGGPGGGDTGLSGSGGDTAAQAGSQTVGGIGGTGSEANGQDGGHFMGGMAGGHYTGGGGGGYFGGGGGAASMANCGTGGGGSGYIGLLTNGITENDNGHVPHNDDPDYIAAGGNAGVGGPGSDNAPSGDSGGGGLIVISWNQ